MSTKKIEERSKKLQAREQLLRRDLEKQEENLKSRAKHVGKIALATGIITLIAYWGYKSVFATTKPRKSKSKVARKENTFLNRVGGLIAPYLTRLIEESLQDAPNKEDQN